MKVLGRTKEHLILDEPLSRNERLEDELSWQDLYVYPDLIEGDPGVVYIEDTGWNYLYWGYLGDQIFRREPDKEVEKELLGEIQGKQQ